MPISHFFDNKIASPFGPLAAFIHRREQNDIQYVEKMRSTLRWWDRWRWIGIALHVALLATLVWLGDKLVPIIREMQAAFPGANPNVDQVVLFAACVGISFGFMFQYVVCGLILSVSGFRSERLLLQFYDQYHDTAASVSFESHVHDE